MGQNQVCHGSSQVNHWSIYICHESSLVHHGSSQACHWSNQVGSGSRHMFQMSVGGKHAETVCLFTGRMLYLTPTSAMFRAPQHPLLWVSCKAWGTTNEFIRLKKVNSRKDTTTTMQRLQKAWRCAKRSPDMGLTLTNSVTAININSKVCILSKSIKQCSLYMCAT